MRLLIILAIVVSLATAFTSVAATRGDSKVITITLTPAQADVVKAARGKIVTIKLPSKQIPVLEDIAREGDGLVVTDLTLSTAHLRAGNKVVLKVINITTKNLGMIAVPSP